MSDWISIDGSNGEGGGQVLRTALALSLATGRRFRIERIRAGREKPGLLRQHLTAVAAAAAIGDAHVTGAAMGSPALTFEPRGIRGGEYRFPVGTAGSVTLVLQAVLPALLRARGASRLVLEGGTHNPWAPPFDFIAKTFVPVLRQMGATVDVTLDAHGFYPAGGGRVVATIEPCARLDRVSLTTRGEVSACARVLLCGLPELVAKRELAVVRERLALDRGACRIEHVASSGPGNTVLIEIASPGITEVITGFGSKGVAAERVAEGACDEAQAYVAAAVPVGMHLADQLLVPMALAGGGRFQTVSPTPHTTTNAQVIACFVDVPIQMTRADGDAWTVCVGTSP